MSKKNKYYAVAKGRKPGIYTVWAGSEGAQRQVNGFKGAVFKGFPKKEEADAFFVENKAKETDATSERNEKDAPSKQTDPQLQGASKADQITIYTDGACINNPGPGGYGAVIVNEHGNREFSGGYRHTTNNRMEMMACIVALSALKKPSSVVLHSDSKYVVDSVSNGWARNWQANGWIKSNKKPALNVDLWEQLLQLCLYHDVEFVWVKGHAGIEYNELCDHLATQGALEQDLPADSVYEQTAA